MNCQRRRFYIKSQCPIRGLGGRTRFPEEGWFAAWGAVKGVERNEGHAVALPATERNLSLAAGELPPRIARLHCNLPGGAAMRIASVGHAVFAATFIVLGIQGLIPGDFVRILAELPKDIPLREVMVVLVYLRPLVYLACGLGLFWPRGRGAAARLLVAFLLLWMLSFKVPFIVRSPTVEVYYQSWGETAVLVAGAWVLYAW